MIDHTADGMPSRAVVDLNNKLKNIIEAIRLAITMSGRLIFFVAPSFKPGELAPRTIGIRGSMQGARTVNTPARNEKTISSVT